MGNWEGIINSGRLPGVTKSQLVGKVKQMTQNTRLAGFTETPWPEVKPLSWLTPSETMHIYGMSLEMISEYMRLYAEEKLQREVIPYFLRVKKRYVKSPITIKIEQSGNVFMNHCEGLLDSGAARSTIGLQRNLPKGVTVETLLLNEKPHQIVDANGKKKMVKGTVLANLYVRNQEMSQELHLKNLELIVVDNPDWTLVLIGAEVFNEIGINPWDSIKNLGKKSLPKAGLKSNLVIRDGIVEVDMSKIRIRNEYNEKTIIEDISPELATKKEKDFWKE